MKVYKLVIVDDEPWIREGLSAIIARICPHWQVAATAGDGVEAIEAIEAHQPQLVLSDIYMPACDGIELHQWIRQHYPDIYVIVVSGYPNFEYARQSLSLGAMDYLIKPVQNELLKTRLEEVYRKLEDESERVLKREKEKQYLMEYWYNHLLHPQQYEINTCENNLKAFGFSLDAAYFRLVCIASHYVEEDSLLNKATQYFIFKSMQELSTEHIRVFSGHDHHIYAIIKADQANLIEEWTQNYGRDITSFLMDNTNFSFSLGISQIFVGIHHFPGAGKQAREDAIRNMNHKKQLPLIDHIKQFIMDNLGYQLSLQTVGMHFYLNSSYLSNLFKQETGENFISYVTRMRIHSSKALLADPNLKVKEISEKIGYASQRHFTKLFKEYEGISPSEYRRHRLIEVKKGPPRLSSW